MSVSKARGGPDPDADIVWDGDEVEPPKRTPIMLHVEVGRIDPLSKGAVEYGLAVIGSHWDRSPYSPGTEGFYSFEQDGHRFTVTVEPVEKQ